VVNRAPTPRIGAFFLSRTIEFASLLLILFSFPVFLQVSDGGAWAASEPVLLTDRH
jgi:hypothetical protein